MEKPIVKVVAEIHKNRIDWLAMTIGEEPRFLTHVSIGFSKSSGAPSITKACAEFLGNLDAAYIDQVDQATIVLNSAYCLIPWHYYDEDRQKDLLILEGALGDFEVISEYQSNTNAYFIYELPTYIVKGFEQVFSKESIKFKHEACLFDDFTRKSTEVRKSNTLFANLGENRVTFVNAKNGKVEFFNSFDVFHQKDLIYYMLLTAQELNLPKETLSIEVWGKHEAFTMALDQLAPYFEELNLRSLNHNQVFTEGFFKNIDSETRSKALQNTILFTQNK